MMGRRPTIADVARAAGVAPSTASVVFSGKVPVRESTRRRVLDAAAELGYCGPDPRAASLRRGRSGIVAVVIDGSLGTVFLDPVMTVMMDGLADALQPIGAGLLLLRTGDDGREPNLATAPVDAAVVVGSGAHHRHALEMAAARGLPVVVVEGDEADTVPQVRLDNREGQAAVAAHLAGLGHRDVVIVSLPFDAETPSGWMRPGADEHITVDVTRQRLLGAREVFPDARVYIAGGSLIDEGYAAGREILAPTGSRPTAVLAQSDVLAVGVIRAAIDMQLRVPEDLSVTGFDGIAADGIAPLTLTTVAQPAAEKGRVAGRAIVAMLEGHEVGSVVLPTAFRAGSTSGPALSRRASPG